MQKIGDSTDTADSAGEFTEGNPAGGIPATHIKARWLNTLQRELANLVYKAGLSLDVNDDGQVLKAIENLVSSAAEFPNISKKPTTLSGYGITDAYTKIEVSELLEGKAAKGTTLSGYGITDAYTKDQVGELLEGKATKGTTLSGYGITDAYTKTAVDQALAGKANKGTTLAAYGIDDAYTKAVTDALLGGKAGKSNSLAGYGILDAYTKGQVDLVIQTAINAIVDSAPGALDTLKELSAALGNDPNFATTVLNALATKADNAAVTAELGKRLLVGAVSQQRPSLSSPTNTLDWNSAALEIRESKQVSEWAPAETGDQWAPGIAFHWAGKIAGKLFMDSLGKLKWNGYELLTKQAGAGFLSGYIQITAGAPVVVSHNLGYVPSLDSVEVFWECVTAQGGWQPGESFKVLTWMQDNTSVASTTGAYAYDVNASTVTIGFGPSASVWALPAKGTGGAVTMNLANWRARIRIKA
ncbi:hypothetical protein [Pseudomonas mosselii]|uniref:hypothetical protein n=1 Tax=Pseudomonas mosselii TaxID=78327 RepID=UPI00198098E9|nr:hypothetical protein [Pseudomonas mosselii]